MMKTTYRIFKGQRPVLAALFFLAALTAGLSSCQKPENEVGIGVQPEEDNIDLSSTDTTTMQMVTVDAKPVRTDESRVYGSLLGNYTDPIFGKVKTSIFTQLRLPTSNVDFGEPEDVEVISLVLDLLLTGEMYGDIVPQSFSVQQITEPMSRDSSYQTDSELPVAENNLIAPVSVTQIVDTSEFVTEDGNSFLRLRFQLKDELAQMLVNASGTPDLQNDDNFSQFFNGIRISSASEDANTFEVNLRDNRSKITMLYHDLASENPDDTLSFDLLINDSGAFFTKVEHDYTGTELEPLQNGQDSISGSERLHVQAQGGVMTKITFPHIMDYAETSTRIINRAELILPLEEGTIKPFFPIIKIIPLTEYNDGEDLLPIRDFFIPTDAEFVNIVYDPVKREYRFNITRHIQGLLEGTVENNVLYLASEHPSLGATLDGAINIPFDVRRSVINGIDDEENAPRLVLTFTD